MFILVSNLEARQPYHQLHFEEHMDIYFDQKGFDVVLEGDDTGVDLKITNTPSDDLMQRLFNRFKTYSRDLWWNTSYGIDYLKDVFGDKRPKSVVDIIIKNEINKEVMVDKITYFESEVVDYKYACKFTVSLINDVAIVTYYILTTEKGLVITDENGDTLTLRL